MAKHAASNPEGKTTPKATVKGMFNLKFWLDALVTLGGFAAAELANRLAGRFLGFIPDRIRPLAGPVIVVAVSPVIKGHYGHLIRIGASLHAANTALGLVGFPIVAPAMKGGA